MAEIISNTIIGCLSAGAEVVTAIIHAGEALFGVGGAVLALVLISSVIYNRK